MEQKRKVAYIQIGLCYLMWGFQPLYWNITKEVESFTLLAFRIIFSFIMSMLILASQKRLGEIKPVLTDKKITKYLLPATLFLAGDWTLYISVIRAGYVLETSLGYYIAPLFMFVIGVLIYKEKSGKWQTTGILIALLGVLINVISFGKLPLLSLAVAAIWATYVSIKKNVNLDGVLSIAIETMILSIFAIIFLLFFRQEQALLTLKEHFWFLVGSGLVTALPMYLYSNSISKLPLIVVCFFQYLSPTFNIFCGLILGERFSPDQLINLSFFVISIIVFTVGEIKQKSA